MSKKNKLLVIVGPTAIGKTSLGLYLADKFAGEIVSADSRQVYKYLNIGTGKDLPGNLTFKNQNSSVGYYELRSGKVWLYDVIEPDERFSAAEYARIARRVIEDIWKRGKLPILVGGTGFYLQAVLEGINTAGIAPDWQLRKKLESMDKAKLQSLLQKLDSAKWANMHRADRQNPRRLIRAIEVALDSQKSKIKSQKYVSAMAIRRIGRLQEGNFKLKIDTQLMIGLNATRSTLYELIDKRVEERLKQGIVDEIRMLLKRGYQWEDPGMDALGYKEWQDFFSGDNTLEKVIERWRYNEHAYARRQLTWFKKRKGIYWFDITEADLLKRVVEVVEKWYYT